LRAVGLFLLDGRWGPVRLGFAVNAPGQLVIGLAFLDLFSLAFGERRWAFTFSDSWAPQSRVMSGQTVRFHYLQDTSFTARRIPDFGDFALVIP
jgi:hypothetical protein